ncbi:Uncharacterised protein [Dermatophilus congolensis]|uniref:Uncharacterized protein n=2 Tax=Dermatophilus congolensis TaxID=1863 RepID=A0A239V2F1_9MICO|nr:Uncharacterised protein [Dermatophilus congolensis]
MGVLVAVENNVMSRDAVQENQHGWLYPITVVALAAILHYLGISKIAVIFFMLAFVIAAYRSWVCMRDEEWDGFRVNLWGLVPATAGVLYAFVLLVSGAV